VRPGARGGAITSVCVGGGVLCVSGTGVWEVQEAMDGTLGLLLFSLLFIFG